jgi:hypothetical protein
MRPETHLELSRLRQDSQPLCSPVRVHRRLGRARLDGNGRLLILQPLDLLLRELHARLLAQTNRRGARCGRRPIESRRVDAGACAGFKGPVDAGEVREDFDGLT